MERSLAAQFKADPPSLHATGEFCGGLHWAALEWLERTVQPGWATLETGAGLSTLVFASRGAIHEAVTPAQDEADRIRAACREPGISTRQRPFHIASSHEELPRWEPRPLDLVLLDGAHGFPYPILDWWYVAPAPEARRVPPPRRRVHGRRRTAVRVPALAPGLARRGRGRLSHRDRAQARRELPPFDSLGEEGVGHVSFGYLPPHRRAVAAVRHRVFSTRAGLAVVRGVRKHAPFLFR